MLLPLCGLDRRDGETRRTSRAATLRNFEGIEHYRIAGNQICPAMGIVIIG